MLIRDAGTRAPSSSSSSTSSASSAGAPTAAAPAPTRVADSYDAGPRAGFSATPGALTSEQPRGGLLSLFSDLQTLWNSGTWHPPMPLPPDTSFRPDRKQRKQAERALKQAGLAPGKVDGKITPRTERALSRFQLAKGLQQSGELDRPTFDALNKLSRRLSKPGAARIDSSGMQSRRIRDAEKSLRKLGYASGKVDGLFTQKTAEAMKDFKNDQPELKGQSGKLGKKARSSLERELDRIKHKPQLRWVRDTAARRQAEGAVTQAIARERADGKAGLGEGARGPEVKTVQRYLRAAGYDPKRISGEVDERTAGMVKQFQRRSGLTPTGQVDPKTWKQLRRTAAQRGVGPKPEGKAAKVKWYEAMVKKSGGTWRSGTNQLNIIGLRGQSVDGKRHSNRFNQWNDTIACVWKGQDGKMHLREFQATTDPGLARGDGRDANGDGVMDIAHLRPGSYPYHLGTHNGSYGAGNPNYNLPVFRDTSHNGSISKAEKKASRRRGDVGYGINLHWGDGYTVGGWSAGCQVVKGSYDHFRRNVTPLLEKNRGQLRYTLIDQSR